MRLYLLHESHMDIFFVPMTSLGMLLELGVIINAKNDFFSFNDSFYRRFLV